MISGDMAFGGQSINAQAFSAQSTLSAGQGQAAAKTLSNGNDPVAIRKAAQSFEAVFLSQMFGHMFEGIETDSLFGGGEGEKMFRPMLLDEYSKMVSQRGGVGIADAIMHTLIRQQEKTQ
jgi:Rod binding domain-containing protein